jgi:hypothetical protein
MTPKGVSRASTNGNPLPKMPPASTVIVYGEVIEKKCNYNYDLIEGMVDQAGLCSGQVHLWKVSSYPSKGGFEDLP